MGKVTSANIKQYIERISGNTSIIPKPFPGRWPTRIWICLSTKRLEESWQYVGKPSSSAIYTALERLKAANRQDRQSNIVIREFDQSNTIFYGIILIDILGDIGFRTNINNDEERLRLIRRYFPLNSEHNQTYNLLHSLFSRKPKVKVGFRYTKKFEKYSYYSRTKRLTLEQMLYVKNFFQKEFIK